MLQKKDFLLLALLNFAKRVKIHTYLFATKDTIFCSKNSLLRTTIKIDICCYNKASEFVKYAISQNFVVFLHRHWQIKIFLFRLFCRLINLDKYKQSKVGPSILVDEKKMCHWEVFPFKGHKGCFSLTKGQKCLCFD